MHPNFNKWPPGAMKILKAGRRANKTNHAISGELKRAGFNYSPAACSRKGTRLKKPLRFKIDVFPASAPVPAPISDVTDFACTFMELTEDTCRYPLWEDGTPFSEQKYCGALPLRGMSYCAFHDRVCRSQPLKVPLMEAAE